MAAVYLLIGAVSLALAQPVFAQATSTFSNTTSGTINAATDCNNPLVRLITVNSSFQVADVNIGILATHTWRGDLQFTLGSPNGTRVQLTNGNTNNLSGDNFNVLLDDSAAQLVNSDGNTTNHSATAPPYQNTFRPDNVLSAFNGETSTGIWRLEICDLFPSADNGVFRRVDLTLTELPTNFADLSLTKSLIGSPPGQGGTATWRLTVTNNSQSTVNATGVVVEEAFPASFTLTSSSGEGAFDAANSRWTVPVLAPGQSASMTLSGSISATSGSLVTNSAEIIAANEIDLDSTVGNGVSGEDDFASQSFGVQSGRAPGTPPLLSCPAGQSVFDWDAVPGWTAGAVSNSFTLGRFGNIDFALTNDGAYVNNALWGGATPNVGTYFNGGLVPLENVLQIVSNQSNRSGEVVLTISLPRSFTGLQFSVFDVDFGANQFADRLLVTGSNGGANVNPVLTNGNVNFVSGNAIIGDGVASNDEATGNVVVTFTQAIDTVTIGYGNHTTAPVDPGQQGIGLHDLYFCTPDVDLTVSKISSIIADPVNGSTNPKAIPGATVEYTITVTNTGVDAIFEDTLGVLDNGPADAKLCLLSRTGGPIIFSETGSNTSLTYSFVSLASLTDDLELSNDDGATFSYTPVDDGTGCDAGITDFRIRPGGTLAGNAGFRVVFRYEIE